MTAYLKQAWVWLLLGLIVFAILDFFNLTSWLLFPYSAVTGKNSKLLSQIGSTPATGGGN